MSVNDRENDNNPAVDRALNILEHLLIVKSATIKELSQNFDIPVVSTSRLIKTLVNRGYVKEKKGYSSTFSLGMKLLNFSQIVYEQIDLRRVAEKHMRTLSDSTNQTSQLAILQQSCVMYINQILPRSPVSIIAPLHVSLPVNVSACGKVLCAWLPEEEQKICLETADLIKATENSITKVDDFIKELKMVKGRGYALDDEEFAKGIGCIAAPILDHSGKIIAAVGITGHIEPYKNEMTFSKIQRMVQEVAMGISEDIGYLMEDK